MFTVASVFTSISRLRYFLNDKGEMLIERGIGRVAGGHRKRNALRALAGTLPKGQRLPTVYAFLNHG
jgi:hypothetical protein